MARDRADERAADEILAEDETAVVRGATGSCVSLVAATVRIQPSGVVTTPGSADATTPVSGGGATILRTRIGQGEWCGPGRNQQAKGKSDNTIAHEILPFQFHCG